MCAEHQSHADDTACGTVEQHVLSLDGAHDPAASEAAEHEEGEGCGEHDRSGVVIHPTFGCDKVDEIAVDADLRNLVGQKREKSEDEHRVVTEELDDACAALFVFRGLFVTDLRERALPLCRWSLAQRRRTGRREM